MKNLLLLFTILFFISCGNTGSVSTQITENRDPNGLISERTQTINGQQTGISVAYHPEKGLPKRIQTLDNGQLNGPVIEVNSRGQVEKVANYKDGKLHGEQATYKFGRVVESSTYKNGKLDGTYRSYFNNSESLQKEAQYKNGIQDGFFRQYNEEGKIVLEYEYKNGEVVEGGLVK